MEFYSKILDWLSFKLFGQKEGRKKSPEMANTKIDDEENLDKNKW